MPPELLRPVPDRGAGDRGARARAVADGRVRGRRRDRRRGRAVRRGPAGRAGPHLHAGQGHGPVRASTSGSSCGTAGATRSTTTPASGRSGASRPRACPDRLALVGDAADGFPGAPRLGRQVRLRGARAVRPLRGDPGQRQRPGTSRGSATRSASRRRCATTWPTRSCTATSPGCGRSPTACDPAAGRRRARVAGRRQAPPGRRSATSGTCRGSGPARTAGPDSSQARRARIRSATLVCRLDRHGRGRGRGGARTRGPRCGFKGLEASEGQIPISNDGTPERRQDQVKAETRVICGGPEDQVQQPMLLEATAKPELEARPGGDGIQLEIRADHVDRSGDPDRIGIAQDQLRQVGPMVGIGPQPRRNRVERIDPASSRRRDRLTEWHDVGRLQAGDDRFNGRRGVAGDRQPHTDVTRERIG